MRPADTCLCNATTHSSSCASSCRWRRTSERTNPTLVRRRSSLPRCSPLGLAHTSSGIDRLQESDDLLGIVGSEPAIRLHLIARHDLVRIGNEVRELCLVPGETRVLHRTGIAVFRQRSCLSSNDPEQAW